jgi:predicted RNA-binding Zn-ribbon protein involved in translation (DUF1610 family)
MDMDDVLFECDGCGKIMLAEECDHVDAQGEDHSVCPECGGFHLSVVGDGE